MSFNNIKSNLRSERGFTIVELLIVIVVIGILAAITIVSFNGVTAKANTANAQSAAEAAIKKAEAYNAETSAYPTIPANLTGTPPAGATYQLTGVTFNTVAATGTSPNFIPPAAAPGTPSTIEFFNCGTGARFDYYNYGTNAWVPMYTGGATSGNCANSTYVKG